MKKTYFMLITIIILLCPGCANSSTPSGINGTGGISGGYHYADEIRLEEQKNSCTILYNPYFFLISVITSSASLYFSLDACFLDTSSF